MKKTALALGLVLVLSACGGSSDKNTNTPTPTPPSTSPAPAPTPMGAYGLQMKNDDFAGAKSYIVDKKDYRKVMIEGQSYDFAALAQTLQSQEYSRVNNVVFSGKHVDDVVYGAVQMDAKGQDIRWFYQGEEVEKMPNAGVAVYKGHSLAVKDGLSSMESGDALVAVNFTNKTVEGRLNTKINDSKFKAEINGNSFASKASDDVRVQGAFFDDEADELAGFFQDKKEGVSGAFGAKKQ